jgi:phage/plasmid-associated DNA primase
MYVDLLPIINTNDKIDISNLDNALIDCFLIIPFTQRFVNKMDISILINSFVKHANPIWHGGKIQAYDEALIHFLIQNYQEGLHYTRNSFDGH